MTTSRSEKFVVDATHNEQRLDKCIVSFLPDESRSTIQKWIDGKEVTVNGDVVSKHFVLSKGDVIVIDHKEKEFNHSTKVDIPTLFEDEVILVIEKPAGVLVHPTTKSAEWTLADFIVEHSPETAGVGDDAQRPGMVHRLDRDASGVMVIAKTQEAFESIKGQFATREVGKEYRAIVHGIPEHASMVIKFKIARSKTKGGKMAARPEHEAGKEAWTEYDVIRTVNDRYAELKVAIKTGRTHQIRAHLGAIQNPIVGDKLYHSKIYASVKEYPRLFLHSHKLSFLHPNTGERVEFISPIPQVFEDFLNA